MNETTNKTKKRAWVKNAVIIFLAVLLVLTFFSNTILNWSLPEVSGQYAGYGTISSSIRTDGTVKANTLYNVTIEETREIKSVKVREGDVVEAGQVLFELEEGDSTELERAKDTLYDLEYQYKLSQLNSSGKDYSTQENEIAKLREDLEEAKYQASRLAKYEVDNEAAQDAIDAAQAIVDEIAEELEAANAAHTDATELVTDITAEQKEIEALLTELSSGGDGDSEAVQAAIDVRDDAKLLDDEAKAVYDDLNTLQTALADAETKVETAEKALAALLKAQAEAEKDYTYKHPMRDAYQKAQMAFNNAKTKVDTWFPNNKETDAYQKITDKDGNVIDNPSYDPEYAAATAERDAAQAALLALTNVTDDELEKLNDKLVTYKDDIYYATLELEEARDLLAIANPEGRSLADIKLEAANAKLAYRDTTAVLTAAQRALNKAIAAREDEIKPILAAKKAEVKAAQDEAKALEKAAKAVKDRHEAAKEVVEDATEVQTKAKEYQTALDSVKALEESIESKVLSLDNLKKDEGVSGQKTQMELEKQLRAIEKQRAEVTKLEEKSISTEVLAKYAGEIVDIGSMAGDEVLAGATMAQISVDGKGYTMSVSVTNEQSRQVNIGDKATVNNYWWGNVDITLSAIKTDRSNPSQNKSLEFTVEGDVSEGQTLNITLGQRQTSYNSVVPKNAVHNDNESDYILVARAKSTPLGNRYVATRVNVTILDKDDYNVAIDAGNDFGYEYVITSANKPIEAGTQVRLAEGQ